jgi:hypothetical protein
MAEIGTPLDTLTEQTYGVKGKEPDTTVEFIGSYPTEPISPFERYLLALEDLQPPVSLNYAPTQTVSYTQPDLRRAFPPVTPSGYAEPPVDPMSYYGGPTTMATGGGGGFDNLGGGFNRTQPATGGGVATSTPTKTTTTSPSTGQVSYKPGEYDPSTGIGVVYLPGPDEQVTSQQTAKQTTSPWGTAVVPGGGGGGRKVVTNPDSPYFGMEYGTPVPNMPGVKIGDYFVDNDGRVYDWETGFGPATKLPDTPLVGPRFETDPVNVTIPVDTKPPVVTTPPTKTETTTPPAEKKTEYVAVRQPTTRTRGEPETFTPFQFIEPTFTRPPLTGPSITNRPITVTPFPELTTIPTDTRRAPEALLRSFRDINYDPEEILAAAMRSMGGRMARRSILNELS